MGIAGRKGSTGGFFASIFYPMFYADHIYQVDVSLSLLSFIDQLPYEDLTPLQAAVAVVQKVCIIALYE